MGTIDRLASKIDDKFLDLANTFKGSLSISYKASYKLLGTDDVFNLVRTHREIVLLDITEQIGGISKINIILYHTRNEFVTTFLSSYYFGKFSDLTNRHSNDVLRDPNFYCDEEDLNNFIRYALLVNKVCHE